MVVGTEDFRSLWRKLTWHRDAPISEPADIAVFKLAELARRSVTVVLSGEGSDELFAGYPKHRYAGLSAAAGIVPAALRSPLLELAAELGTAVRLAPANRSTRAVGTRPVRAFQQLVRTLHRTGTPRACCAMRHITQGRIGYSSPKATP